MLSPFLKQPHMALSRPPARPSQIDPPSRKEQCTPYSVVRCDGAPCTRDGTAAEECGECCLGRFLLVGDGTVGGGDGVAGVRVSWVGSCSAGWGGKGKCEDGIGSI